MSDGTGRRPRGWARHYGGLLAPGSAAAARVAGERAAGLRVRRLTEAAVDGVRQRARPTRPRMRALVAGPGGRLGWSDVAAPASPGPDAAVVRPIAVSTCDLDPLVALGASPFPLPLRIGHECVAEVVAVGERVLGVRPGQRVVVPFQISCGTCVPCRSGRTSNCTSVPPISMYGFGVAGGHWGGAYADRLAVPYADAMLVPLPDGVDPVAAASVADTVCDGYRHVAPHLPQVLAADPDAHVIVVASVSPRTLFSPSSPLYAGLVAKALGARRVVLADSRPHVRDHAERLGLAAVAPRALRHVPPAPLVADVSGSAAGLRAALGSTAPDGICNSAGSLHRTVRIPTLRMFGRNVTLRISRAHVRTLIPGVLDLMADGRLHPETVTTTVAPLDDAPAVLREHYRGGGTKTVLTV